jgi:type VI secretion system secreted protein Hcp
MAAVELFLKIDGIQGESKDAKHANEIDVDAFSWGETNVVSHTGGGGGGAGKVAMQDFHFTKRLDKASPVLFLACASGKHFPKAVLSARKAGQGQQDYLVITLSDVAVSSYQVGGAESGEVGVDQTSLAFSRIVFEYRPQKPDGSLAAPVKAGWDLKTNKAI